MLAVLVTSGLIQLWQIVAITAARGIMVSFNMPARQSLIADLVPGAAGGVLIGIIA